MSGLGTARARLLRRRAFLRHHRRHGPGLHPRAADDACTFPRSELHLLTSRSAKVLMKTTFGDLELELWGTQTPQTTRNFLQLCLDGYYDDTIFHRLVPGFIIQGGDPTGTGHGGEAIYPGGLFADEFHQRLKYNRRGLVGMANGGRPDDNGSQFFFTLGDTKELNGKNTLFGKIVGDTVFNLVRMGELETEEVTERPVYPPKITGTEVLVNPYEDLKKRETKKSQATLEDKKVQKGKKKKGGKTLLSFAGNEEEGEEPAAPVRKKPKFNTKLVVDAPPPIAEKEEPALKPPPPKPAPKAATIDLTATPPPPPPSARETSRVAERAPRPAVPSRSPSPAHERNSKLSETEAQIAAVRASLRRRSPTPPPKKARTNRSLLALQKEMLPATAIQGRKRRRGKNAGDEGDDAFEAMRAFQAKLSSAAEVATPDTRPGKAADKDDASANGAQKSEEGKAAEAVPAPPADTEATLCDLHFIPNCLSCRAWDEDAQDDAETGDADVSLWAHTLSFEKDRLGKDLTWKKKNEELVVIDPKEKARELTGSKMRADRDGRRYVEKPGEARSGGRRTIGGAGARREADRERVQSGRGGGSGSGSRGGGGRW